MFNDTLTCEPGTIQCSIYLTTMTKSRLGTFERGRSENTSCITEILGEWSSIRGSCYCPRGRIQEGFCPSTVYHWYI